MAKFIAEYTDTFGHDANYSWVRRKRFEVDSFKCSQRMLMRRAKKALDLTNMRGRTFTYDGDLEFRPYRSCTVLFVFEDTCRTDEEYNAIPDDLPY